jgi:Methylase involved in ubiquinone/menaquinone biosynthesis
MLDLGGTRGVWENGPVRIARIDLLNSDARLEGTMVGDACALPFADGSYDIVFSNSTIEHVGDWERQEAFAREARRVGRALWIQTPARENWFEPHYLAPFVHWLPRRWRRWAGRWLTPRGVVRCRSDRVDRIADASAHARGDGDAVS